MMVVKSPDRMEHGVHRRPRCFWRSLWRKDFEFGFSLPLACGPLSEAQIDQGASVNFAHVPFGS